MISNPLSFIEKAPAMQSESCRSMLQWVYLNSETGCLEAGNGHFLVQIPVTHTENESLFIHPDAFKSARVEKENIETGEVLTAKDLGSFPEFDQLLAEMVINPCADKHLIVDAQILYELSSKLMPRRRQRPLKLTMTENGLTVHWLLTQSRKAPPKLVLYKGPLSFVGQWDQMDMGQRLAFDVNYLWRVAQAICEGMVGRQKSWLLKLFLSEQCYLIKPFVDVRPPGRRALLTEYKLEPNQMR